MMYDLAEEPPLPGSLLESLFLLTAKRRQESEFHKTRALVAAALVPHIENGGKMLKETLDLYRDSLFPFLKKTTLDSDAQAKVVLKKWAQDIEAIKIRPLWTREQHQKFDSRLKKGSEKVKQAEEERRQRKHWRMT
jgi:hypothetical protein